MLTSIPVSTSLAGLLNQGFLSRNEADYEPFRLEAFVVSAEEEDEPVRIPSTEDLDRILGFALCMTLATDPTR